MQTLNPDMEVEVQEKLEFQLGILHKTRSTWFSQNWSFVGISNFISDFPHSFEVSDIFKKYLVLNLSSWFPPESNTLLFTSKETFSEKNSKLDQFKIMLTDILTHRS